MSWNLPLFYSAVPGFLLVSLLYGLGFSLRRPGLLRLGVGFAAAGLAVHLAVVAHEWVVRGRLPTDTWSDVTALLSTAVLAAIVATGASERLRVLGAFIAPVGLAFCMGALWGPGGRPAAELVSTEMHPLWQAMHVGSIILAFVALTVTFGASVLYLVTARRLKARLLDDVSKRSELLPSLEGLDKAVHRSLTIGLALLTVGLVAGAVWAGAQDEPVTGIAPKATLSVLAWLILSIGLQLRLVAGWSGRRGASMVLGGYLWLVLAMFAVGHVQ